MNEIELGNQLVTGERVSIPLHHTVITGVTRLSGKTTAIEALLSRMPPNFAGLVFRTKRGEIAFDGAKPVGAYYRPSLNDAGMLDWPYVLSLLQAIMGEKMKLEQSFIINAAKISHTLREFYENISKAREKATRGFDESIYTNLQAYMELILPQLEQHPFSETLHLDVGLNVMELGHLSEQVQSLVIASCLQEIHKTRERIITVIPEAWKFLPQARGNPVKWAAQHLVREGGASDLWLWLDSQDITRVDKDALKSVGVWIMGVQHEINEVKRVIAQLPTQRKPRPDEIMGLAVGHFWVAAEGSCREVYVQPTWLTEEQAHDVSTGQKELAELTKGRYEALPTNFQGYEEIIQDSDRLISDLQELLAVAEKERDEWQTLSGSQQEKLTEAIDKLRVADNDLAKAHPLLEFRAALLQLIGGELQGSINRIDFDQLFRDHIEAHHQADSIRLPLPDLKQQFQIETIGRLEAELTDLEPKVRQGMNWIIAIDKTCTFRDVCNGLGLPLSGNPYVTWSRGINALVKQGWLFKDTHGLSSNVKGKVEKALSVYNATPTEVDQTIDHLISHLHAE